MRSRFSCVLATVSVPGTGSVSAEPSGQVTPLPANHSLSLAASAAVVTDIGTATGELTQELTGLVAYINTHAVGGVTAFFISAALYCASAVVIGRIGSLIDRKVRIVR